jgi:hypothetical protein
MTPTWGQPVAARTASWGDCRRDPCPKKSARGRLLAVAGPRAGERPIFSRRLGPAAGSDCDRAACAGARCAASRAADYRGPLHVVVRACRPRRDEVTRPCPLAHVPSALCRLCALHVVRPSPSSASSPSLAFLVLTLFLPCSYLVLTREGAFAPSFPTIRSAAGAVSRSALRARTQFVLPGTNRDTNWS